MGHFFSDPDGMNLLSSHCILLRRTSGNVVSGTVLGRRSLWGQVANPADSHHLVASFFSHFCPCPPVVPYLPFGLSAFQGKACLCSVQSLAEFAANPCLHLPGTVAIRIRKKKKKNNNRACEKGGWIMSLPPASPRPCKKKNNKNN